MGTKTDEAAGAKEAPGTEDTAVAEDTAGTDAVRADEAGKDETADAAKADLTKTDADTTDAADADAHAADAEDDADDLDDLDDVTADSAATAKSSGVGEGAAAVVAAALGVIGLSGGWLGTIASARENLYGQLETQQGASVATTVQAMYGDSWKATALIAGLFALAALVTAFVVLAKPAFGAPGKPQAPWIKSVAWAGLVLGVIGLVLAIAKYSDLLLGLPSVPS
ncbi:hypothetical protein [Streptomyces formicae]|uniref:Uncharacterized protein n=1 Tax=Streptomyces formicae TaxID=1616117 RepID=A0A291QG64_9ACTN|nr:hypothetical protein [Streptomyces formicae]ATL30681.1 hypothetical protein KY5_5663 [Streptomyces formicae]